MPRLARSEKVKRSESILSVIAGELERQHIPRMDFYRSIHMSSQTFCKRKAAPGNFTLDELFEIATVLNIGMERLCGGVIR